MPTDQWRVEALYDEPDCWFVKIYAIKHERTYRLAYPKQESFERMAEQIRSVFK